jgi:titin
MLEQRVVPHGGDDDLISPAMMADSVAVTNAALADAQPDWNAGADIQLDNQAALQAAGAPPGAGLTAPIGTPASGALGASSDPAVVGQWGNVFSWPYETVAAALLPNDQVFTFAYNPNSLVLWNLDTKFFGAPAPIVGYNPFCGALALLPDGNLFEAGGAVAGLRAGGTAGAANASIYDPFTNTWAAQPNMNNLRWYPSTITLSNGDLLVDSGLIDSQDGRDTLPQVWQASTQTWRDLTTAQRDEDLFPRMFVDPNGQVVEVGPGQQTMFLDTSGTGAWINGPNNNYGDRYKGSAVMYAPGKILIAGGSLHDTDSGSDKNIPTNTAEVLDLNQSSPAWQYTASMASPRKNFNFTILADGQVLVTGGTSGIGKNNTFTPVYAAEEWNPTTGQFTTMASMDVPRWYHSTALLLPDGSVLTSGGVGLPSAQIYYPPYLFQGQRPTIAAAPAAVGYGQSFFVQTPDAASISTVHLIRLGTATHGFNFDQRVEDLSFKQVSGGLTVTAPTSEFDAVPGYYMLFILNSQGVPSVAKFVQLTQTPAAPTDLAAVVSATSQSGGVNLSWTANSSNANGFGIESSADGVNFTQIDTVAVGSTSYFDVNGTSASYYRVYAFNDSGNSGYSNTAFAGTLLSDVPVAPTNLTASPLSSSQVEVAWSDNAQTETGYSIERSTDGTTFTLLATVGADATSFLDTGLTTQTTYWYRVQAFNAAGDSDYSNTSAGMTDVDTPPITPSQLTATVVTPSTVTLAWSNNSSNSDGYTIERSTDGVNYAPITVVGPTETRYADINLASWTTLFYRVWGFNGAGASGYDTVTIVFPLTTPGDPSNLSVVTFDNGMPVPGQVNTAEATLTWTNNTVSPNLEEGFTIERSNDGVNFTQIATTAAGVTTLTDTNLAGNVTYYYRVRAFNINGYSNYSNTGSGTTPYSIPPTPQALTPTPVSDTEIDLFWTENYADPASFNVQESLTKSHGWVKIATVLPTEGGNVTTYAVTGLTPGTTYWFRIQAANTTGHSRASAVRSGTTFPADPSSLMAAAYLPNQINLSWVNNSNADGTSIERSTDDVNFTQVGSVGTGITTYQDTSGIEGGILYYYRVRAYNSGGDSNYSNTASVLAITTPPASPSNPAATGIFANEIYLSWTNNATNADGFYIERSTDGSNFSQIDSVAATVTSYTDTNGLTPGTLYYYRIRAYNSAGASDYSNTASAVAAIGLPFAPTNLTATGVSGSEIDLSWTNVALNADGILIERSADGVNFTQIASLAATASSYQDTGGLISQATYYYRVRAYNSAGNSDYSNTASAAAEGPIPAKPTNLNGSIVSSTSVYLTWTDNSNNEDGFQIYYSTDGNTYKKLATVAANVTTYTATGLTSNTKYYFKVRAYNSGGYSGYSNVIFFFLPPSGPNAPTSPAALLGIEPALPPNGSFAAAEEPDPFPGALAQASDSTATPPPAAIVETLGAELKSQCWWIRADAARQLGSLGRDAAAAVPALTEALLEDFHHAPGATWRDGPIYDYVRAQIAAALGSIGPAAQNAIPTLQQAMHYQAAVGAAVVDALQRIH